MASRITSGSLLVALSSFLSLVLVTGCGGTSGGDAGSPTPTAAATPTFSPAAGTFASAQSVTLSSTTSGAAIHYTLDGSIPTASSATYTAAISVGSSMTVKAIATATGYTDSSVGSAAYVINIPLPVAATPTFSPVAGTFASAQSVTLSSTTSGAAIHYTLDGSIPTASSATYAAAISVGTSMTVKAIATATGYTNSAVGSADFVINIPLPVAATPTFSPAAGIYTSAQSVTLSSTTSGAAIHYTLDGSIPTASSATYTAAISVGSSMTVKAIATATGYTDSSVGSAAYVINIPTLRGIALPSEVSALPTGTAPPAGVRASPRFSSRVASLSNEPPADSDYAQARTFKFVSEQSLGVFDILNTLFNAIGQTHYDDVAVLNQPAYSAMVAFQQKDQTGQEQKQLVKWVVQSTRDSASTPNVVKLWMRQSVSKDPTIQTIQAKVVITEAPIQNPDGSYTDYGVWRMDARTIALDPSGWHFVATATRDVQGRAVIMMEQGSSATPTRGILYKSASSGLGKVKFTTDVCGPTGCTPTLIGVPYAYDAQNVTLKYGGASPVTKARNSFVDLVNRYGLYDATTGEDVAKTRRFGFPIRGSVGGTEVFGYYGAWQGRHQLWANGSSVPPGLQVNRADVPPGQTGAAYTASEVFKGILVKRSYAPALASDLTGLVVQTWDNESFEIGFDGTKWCTSPMFGYPPGTPPPPGPMPGVCAGQNSADFTDFIRLVSNPNDKFRNVMIFQPGMTPKYFVYLTDYPAGAPDPGFYEAEMLNGPPQRKPSATVKTVFQDTDRLQVNVGGMVYVSYDGTGWIRKTVESFDDKTMTATFKAGGDLPFTLKTGPEYYFNNGGTNYVVKVENGATVVKLEMQSVANPNNASSFVPAGTVFEQQWCQPGSTCSTYEFVTDRASQKFMKLIYKTVSEADAGSQRVIGGEVDFGMFGFKAVIGGAPVQFNWDYPQTGQTNGGTQQYLVDTGGAYVMLDDPIRLESVDLTNAASLTRRFTLQFDGNWMQGLPNVFQELNSSGFLVTNEIKQKAFSVPTGMVIGSYIVKQLQISEYMETLPSATPLDLTEAKAITVDVSVPVFVDPVIGDIPANAPLLFSEGKPVTP